MRVLVDVESRVQRENAGVLRQQRARQHKPQRDSASSSLVSSPHNAAHISHYLVSILSSAARGTGADRKRRRGSGRVGWSGPAREELRKVTPEPVSLHGDFPCELDPLPASIHSIPFANKQTELHSSTSGMPGPFEPPLTCECLWVSARPSAGRSVWLSDGTHAKCLALAIPFDAAPPTGQFHFRRLAMALGLLF
jgi:hypothetical protein